MRCGSDPRFHITRGTCVLFVLKQVTLNQKNKLHTVEARSHPDSDAGSTPAISTITKLHAQAWFFCLWRWRKQIVLLSSGVERRRHVLCLFLRRKTVEPCPAALMSVSEFVTVRTTPAISTDIELCRRIWKLIHYRVSFFILYL